MAVFPALASTCLLIGRLFPQRLRRFGMVGVTAAVVDFSVFNLILAMIGPSMWHAVAASSAGLAAAATTGYLLNARYTFDVARSRGSFARYIVVALIGIGIHDTGLFVLLSQLDASSIGMTNLAKAIAVVPSAAWNFIGFSLFAFRARLGAGAVHADVVLGDIDGRR
ncbi:MAG: GtrA family protein [Dehalococcoidia bacterium]|nr:GtrA family protein [Dehalococcoidia bacterium]